MRRPTSTMSARNAVFGPLAHCTFPWADERLSSACFACRPSGLSGAISTSRRQTSVAPLRSCLPNARTTPRFSSDLRVLRIELQRMLELLDREVRLVVVVVAHAQVGADVHVFRVERQRLAVPLDRIGVAAGIVVEISELRARDSVLGDRGRRQCASACTCDSSSMAGARRAWHRSGRRWRRRDGFGGRNDVGARATWTPAGFR